MQIQLPLSTALLVALFSCGGQQTQESVPLQSQPDVGAPGFDSQPAVAAKLDQPDASAEPPECHGMECFGNYRPKITPDTVSDYYPAVNNALEALPPADIESLTELIDALVEAKRAADRAPGTFREGNVILGAALQEYVPSLEELIASALGDRVASVVSTSPAAAVKEALSKSGFKKRELTYGKIEIWHADVMGSGRFFYASEPEPTVIRLP